MAPDPSPPQVVTDGDRLAALEGYAILDTPPEEGFDDVVQLATLACDAPVALVSLVAGDRQWFKARHNFPHCETDLGRSVCAHALVEPDLLVIPDLAADPRTRDNPLVTGEPHIRFYAGAPLRAPQGHVLGSLCVIDKVSRPEGLTERQSEALRGLARQVMALMELRRSVAERDSFIARRLQAEQRLAALVQAGSDIVYSMTPDWGVMRHLSGKGFMADTRGADPDWLNTYIHPDDQPGVLAAIAEAVRSRTPFDLEHRVRTADGSLGWARSHAIPLPGGDGEVREWFGTAANVTERRFADRLRGALLELGDRLRDLDAVKDMTRTTAALVGRAVGATRAGFGRLDPDGRHVTIEPDWTAPGVPSIAGRHRFADWGDIGAELLRGDPLVIRDARTDARTAGAGDWWSRARVGALVHVPIQAHGRTVAVFLVHDDKPRPWRAVTISFLRSVADRLAVGVARLEAEAEQRMLNEELSHRMKNMLTMVQAIARQTLKGVTEQDAVDALRQRLHALSSAHDVLLQTSWDCAPMREVVAAVLGAAALPGRFTIGGPDVTLGPRATLSLSLLLHELATNAVKHGALSSEAGHIDAAWRLEGEELVLAWTERDGPAAAEPTRRGFGSRLIHAGLIGTGGVTLRYRSSGLEAEMRARLDQVQAT